MLLLAVAPACLFVGHRNGGDTAADAGSHREEHGGGTDSGGTDSGAADTATGGGDSGTDSGMDSGTDSGADSGSGIATTHGGAGLDGVLGDARQAGTAFFGWPGAWTAEW